MCEELAELIQKLRGFAEEREWGQFHTPKNLAAALSVECAELLEHFQWKHAGTADELGADTMEQVRLEAADVFLYLLQFCDRLDIDLIDAAHRKIAMNAKKYPVALAKGSARKMPAAE